jgi:UDP-glucose 4-epimerase
VKAFFIAWISFDEEGKTGMSQLEYAESTSPYKRTKIFGKVILADLVRRHCGWTIVALSYLNLMGCDTADRPGEDSKSIHSDLFTILDKAIEDQVPAPFKKGILATLLMISRCGVPHTTHI